MNRRGQAVVMALVGAAIVRISVTDDYLRFVKAGMRPLLIAAGLLLLATAAMTLWYQWRRDPAHSDDLADPAHAHHDHSHEPGVAWLLIVPVAVLALVAPPALGADAAARAGMALQAPTSDFAPLPDGDPVSVGLLDYASRAVFEEGRSLAGRTVLMTGFVMIDDDITYLARINVSCCAADGRPIKVGLTGALPAGLAPDTWISVTGTYSTTTAKDPINGTTIPFVEAVDVQLVDEPSDPYQI